MPTFVIARYILAVKYTDKRQIEIVSWGGITQDVGNLNNMGDDKRDHFEARQYHNHVTDNRQISNCIDNLNVYIGLDHDWCNSASNVERNTTNEPDK